jgi:hypothetical protein
MKDIQIKVTITRLAKFESDTGISISEAFSGNGTMIASMVSLIKACSNADDDDIDNFVATNGFDELTNRLTAAMEKSGFLGKPTANQAKK